MTTTLRRMENATVGTDQPVKSPCATGSTVNESGPNPPAANDQLTEETYVPGLAKG